jgi:hypothetical protein
VLEDADLDEAVKAAAFGAFMNQGQICMSTERIIVVDAVADEFAKRFKAKVETLCRGRPARARPRWARWSTPRRSPIANRWSTTRWPTAPRCWSAAKPRRTC